MFWVNRLCFWLMIKTMTTLPDWWLFSGQLVTKFAKRNSFFNFFTPPKSVREWILDPKKSALMEAHFEIGLFFKETFVTKAILFYASHSIKNLGDDDDVRPAEVPTSPTRKSLFTKRSDKMKNKRGVPATSTSIVKRPDSSVSQFSSTSEVTKSHLGDKTNTLPRSKLQNSFIRFTVAFLCYPSFYWSNNNIAKVAYSHTPLTDTLLRFRLFMISLCFG